MAVSRSQASLVVAASLLASGCGFLQTPCGRVASSICTIPGEEKSCTFLHDVARDNKLAQDACVELEPAAVAYAKEPSSILNQGRWLAARVALAAFGLVGDATKTTTREKFEKAGEKAGKKIGAAAGKAGEELGKAGDKLGDAAAEAGDAIGDAIGDLTK